MNGVVLVHRPPTELAAALPRLRDLVSPLTGVVTRVFAVLPGLDDPRLFRLGSQLAGGEHVIGAGLDHLAGTGGMTDAWASAWAAAVGEAAERYSATYVPGPLPLATAAELGELAVRPGRFALFHPRQHEAGGLAYVPFTETTRVRWARGFDVPSGRPCLLPAQLVHLVRPGDLADDTPVGYATSSGLAAAVTPEEALLRGLFELVERDAFMITWACRLSLPRIDWSGEPATVSWLRRFVEPTGLQVTAVDLSPLADAPVVLAVVRDRRSGVGSAGVGAAAASDGPTALRKAVCEALAVRSWAKQLAACGAVPESEDGAAIDDFDAHVRYYAHPARARLLAFLDGSSRTVALDSLPRLGGPTPLAQLEELVARLLAQGVRVHAVDVTAPDVAEAGLVVMRVVAPELCPLDVLHDARFLGGPRLTERAVAAGLLARPPRFEELNPLPHPFP